MVCDVPQNPWDHSNRVREFPTAAFLGSTQDARILLRKVLSLDVLSPGIQILDGQAHHEIAGVLGNIEGL